MELNKFIDHTLLKPCARRGEIEKLCKEAVKYGFASVCVNPCNVRYAAKLLKNSLVKVCSVAGFPLGAVSSKIKLLEVKQAIADGAEEIDMVINVGKLIDGDLSYVKNEISQINRVCRKKGVLLKVIVETCFLSEENIASVCALIEKAGAAYIKTSTGFGTRGACFEDIKIFKKYLRRGTKIKASGGIKTREDAEEYIRLGCSRLGTSRGVEIADTV